MSVQEPWDGAGVDLYLVFGPEPFQLRGRALAGAVELLEAALEPAGGDELKHTGRGVAGVPERVGDASVLGDELMGVGEQGAFSDLRAECPGDV